MGAAHMDLHVTELNPYAAPEVSLEASPVGTTGDGVWREGRRLVAVDGARFPARCVVCNSEEDLRWRRHHVARHPVWLLALIFVPYGVLVYLVLALVLRRRGSVWLAVCGAHVRRRRWAHGLFAIAIVAGVALCRDALTTISATLAVGSVFAVLALIVAWFGVTRLATPRHIGDGLLTLDVRRIFARSISDRRER